MSSALAITAFDHTTSKITIPAHGLPTGTGPCALMNVGGVLPQGSPGFAPVTDYFLINVDANTVQLAGSSTLAFAGTAIAFADNGSGAATLLVGVPYRRPRTHVATVFNLDGSVQTPGSQIFSADLNANYDAWATAFALLSGQPQTLLDGPTFSGPLVVGGQLMPFADFTFTAAGGGSAVLTAANHPLHTGSGPIRGSTSSALPGGFPAATDVFAIKLSASTFSVATSLANALAGVAIAMSTAGTGTQTINHQPTTTRISDVTATRNLTVGGSASIAGAATVSGAAVVTGGATYGANANLQLSGTGNVKHGVWTRIITPALNALGTGNTFVVIDGSTILAWSIMLDQYFQSGDAIVAVRINVTDNATGPTRASAVLNRVTDGVGSLAPIAGPTLTAGTAGTLQQISLTGFSEAIAAGKTHTLKVVQSGGTAAMTLWSIEVDYTR